MKLSYNLLKQYVALPDDLTMEQLAYDLTMRTVEVEGTTNLAEQYEHIVAGKILSVAPHPDADRLRIVQVDVGPEGKQQIVWVRPVRVLQGKEVAQQQLAFSPAGKSVGFPSSLYRPCA